MSSTILLRILVALLGFVIGTSLVSGRAESLSWSSQNLTPYRTCTVTAMPSSTTAVIDAHVQQANATTNFGTATSMSIASRASANRRIHIKFDLGGCSPAIPSTATVRLASLRLYASALAATCRTIAIFRVGSSWTEAGITWNNQPFGTTINNPALGSATDTFSVGTPVGCANRVTGYVAGADVTTDVAAFVAGSATNNGWMLRDGSEGSATTYTNIFSAKDLGTPAQAPQLVVTYVTAP